MERIVVKATEERSAFDKPVRTAHVPGDAPSTLLRRTHRRWSTRAKDIRIRIMARMERRKAPPVAPEEQARRYAEYEADYERWLAAQGFPTNLEHTRASDGEVLLLPERKG
jgi:hypothetical protein